MATKKSTLKHLKKMKQEFSAFEELFNLHIEKIKKEHNKILIQKMNELISDISKNEDLDELYLREKYLNIKDNSETSKKDKNESKNIMIEPDLLTKIIIDNISYYFENKDNGNVYDTSSTIVGQYKNGEIILN